MKFFNFFYNVGNSSIQIRDINEITRKLPEFREEALIKERNEQIIESFSKSNDNDVANHFRLLRKEIKKEYKNKISDRMRDLEEEDLVRSLRSLRRYT